MPHVVFALRSDALLKPGGDSTKVARYRDSLASRGWTSQVVTSAAALEKASADVVHLMNLDLPLENLHYARIARNAGTPIALSTIRHPLAGVTAMYKHGGDEFYRLTRRIGLTAERALTLREQIKTVRGRRIPARFDLRRFTTNQRHLLDLVDIYLPMALGEDRKIREDLPTSTPSRIVRNGVTFSLEAHREETRTSYDAISVGRVEPRKNSLALARAATRIGRRILFVGAINEKHARYAADFRREVDESSFVTHIGQVRQDELPQLLRKARAYVNPAWFEVVSQADVEAATVGLPIVTTTHSYIEDALGDSAPRLDPTMLVTAPEATLTSGLERATKLQIPTIRSWDSCGAELASTYADIAK